MEGEEETPTVVENAWAYKVIAFIQWQEVFN